MSSLKLTSLIPKQELEKVLDKFTATTGVGCIITDVYGNPLTRPSNWCKVCSEYHRQTKLGGLRCKKSDKMLGEEAYRTKKPVIGLCGNGAFLDAVVPIMIGDKHIANVAAGQVLYEKPKEETYIQIAKDIGVNDIDNYLKLITEVKIVTQDEFKKIVETLDYIANMISNMAYQRCQIINHQKQLEQLNNELLSASKEITGLIRTFGSKELNKHITSYYNYKLEDIKLTTKTFELLMEYFSKIEIEIKKLMLDLTHPVVEAIPGIIVAPILPHLTKDKELLILKAIYTKANNLNKVKVCIIDATSIESSDLSSINSIIKIINNIKSSTNIEVILVGINTITANNFKIKSSLPDALQEALDIINNNFKKIYS